MVSTKNLKAKPGRSKKLVPKFIRPLLVLKRHSRSETYQLQLPPALQDVHETFHISLLKCYVLDIADLPPPSTDDVSTRAKKSFMNLSELLNPAPTSDVFEDKSLN